MNAISVKNIKKTYSNFMLDNVSFDVPQGCIVGLVGENGAGKSTTIRIIMNTTGSDGGEVTVLDCDPRSKEFVNAKQHIGIVQDEAHYPEMLTAKQVNAIMKHTYINWDETVYFDYLKRFNIDAAKKIKDYSRGMKMKVSIAVALSHRAKLLVLDEATSGLDPMVREEILDILNEFTRDEQNSILLSSHIISDLEKICDYIVFLHGGKLILFEEKDRILEKYALLKLTEEQADTLAPSAIVRKKRTPYGYEVLALKQHVPHGITAQHTTLEDIILMLPPTK